MSQSEAPRPTRRPRSHGQQLTPWLFAAPGLVLLLVFLIVPFALAFVFSFTDQRLIGNDDLDTKFVGARNYLRLFDDDSFWAALKNNFFSLIHFLKIGP